MRFYLGQAKKGLEELTETLISFEYGALNNNQTIVSNSHMLMR